MSAWHLTLLVAFALTGRSWADGGALQFSILNHGTQVSVFTNPGVPAAGLVDLSVLVQDSSKHSALLDAEVVATLVPKDEVNRASAWSPPICASAAKSDLQAIPLERAGGQNLLYYSAGIQIPHGGNWKLRVQVTRGGQAEVVDGELQVANQVAPWTNYWHLFLLPIVAVAGFVGIQNRTRRRESA